MFKKDPKEGEEIRQDDVETIVGPSVKIEGDFSSNGNVMVAGIISGKFSTNQNLRVEEKARILADVEAAEAVIAGEVQGNVVITGHAEILSSAKITGDITTGSISIQQGAVLNGNFKMANTAINDADMAQPKDEPKDETLNKLEQEPVKEFSSESEPDSETEEMFATELDNE